MKRIVLSAFLLNTAILGFGQGTVEFDIVSYSEPSGWNRKDGDGFIAYTVNNNANGEYARILIFKSLPGTGNIDTDFSTEWRELVQINYQPEEFAQINVSDYKDGWVSKIGVAPFKYQNTGHAALLITMVKAQTKMSFVFITNTTTYQTEFEDFASSLNFAGTEEAGSPGNPGNATGSNEVGAAPGNNLPASEETASPSDYDRRLIGRWNRSGASHPHYADAASWGTAGYTSSRYEFKDDGTYLYSERSFRITHPNITLVKERGRFSVSNNSITVIPETSIIESYTKKNDVDELGTLVNSENRQLEVATYTFRFHYFSGIQEWNLVLQASNPTKRDGNFSSNDTFPNAWYFDQKFIDTDLTSLKGN